MALPAPAERPEVRSMVTPQVEFPRFLLLWSLLAFSVAGVSGCGTGAKPTEPNVSAEPQSATGGEAASLSVEYHPGSRGFYPLEVGNRWTYHRQIITYVRNDSCPPGECPVFASVTELSEERELVGTESLYGRDYVAEELRSWDRITPGVPDTTTTHIFYRQDRAGLYEADAPIKIPEALLSRSTRAPQASAVADEPLSMQMRNRGVPLTAVQAAAYDEAMSRLQAKLEVVAAALTSHGLRWFPGRHGRRGGPLENELVRLKYPLHPGQHWIVREGLPLTSRVIRREQLDLPAGTFRGYRIRLVWDTFDSRDRVLLWYGRQGLLKVSIHVETPYTDYEHPYGNGGTVVFQDHMVLESLDLVEPS
jgi:hypothetical protein